MTQQEIEERLNKSIAAIKSIEQIVKSLDASYDTHITRIGWLKHLADSCVDLKRLELEFLKHAQLAQQQISIQQAQQAAAAQKALAEAQVSVTQPAPVVPTQPVVSEQEVVKKTKKKAE